MVGGLLAADRFSPLRRLTNKLNNREISRRALPESDRQTPNSLTKL
jgi:hypothetical protein